MRLPPLLSVCLAPGPPGRLRSSPAAARVTFRSGAAVGAPRAAAADDDDDDDSCVDRRASARPETARAP